MLAAKPHIAGSDNNHKLAESIFNKWKGFNFDDVELINYTVLLSYPNYSEPNVLKLMHGSDVIYNAHTNQEPPLIPLENDSSVVPPFNAYSASGVVSVSNICTQVQTSDCTYIWLSAVDFAPCG